MLCKVSNDWYEWQPQKISSRSEKFLCSDTFSPYIFVIPDLNISRHILLRKFFQPLYRPCLWTLQTGITLDATAKPIFQFYYTIYTLFIYSCSLGQHMPAINLKTNLMPFLWRFLYCRPTQINYHIYSNMHNHTSQQHCTGKSALVCSSKLINYQDTYDKHDEKCSNVALAMVTNFYLFLVLAVFNALCWGQIFISAGITLYFTKRALILTQEKLCHSWIY